MSGYISLRENQGLAHQATKSDPSNRHSTSNGEMNGHRSASHMSAPHHNFSNSRSRRHMSSLPIINAAYYHSSRARDGHIPSKFHAQYLTHLYYAAATVDYDGNARLVDESADFEVEVHGHRGALQACLALKQHKPDLQILLSVGDSHSQAFEWATAEPLRRDFAVSLRALVLRLGLNGVDVNWHTPQNPQHGKQLIEFLAILRGYLPRLEGFTIAVTLPGEHAALENLGPDIDQLNFFTDIINVRTYGFTGPQSPHSGHHAQLLADTQFNSQPVNQSCQAAINYLTHNKVRMDQVVLGIPCHAQEFLGATGPGQQYKGTRSIAFNQLPALGAAEHVDRTVQAAHACDGASWISFDNVETVSDKAEFARRWMGLGGLFYCEVTADKLNEESLIAAGHDSFRGG